MLEIISRNEKAQRGLTRKQLLNRWTMRSANIELGDLVERYHYDYQEPAVTKITKIPNSSLNFPISVPFAVDLSEEVITPKGSFSRWAQERCYERDGNFKYPSYTKT